jgi:hypothetical protein
MATSGPTQLPAYLSNDADFQTWCQGIATALVACGLVKTGDTGQQNNATVTRPGTTNTASGYEIYRFDDTLQSTKPIYIKVEYGTGGATDRPSLWITVGTGTNGAGTLSGNVGTRRQNAQNSSKTASTTLPLYASGAMTSTDARVTLAFSVDTAANGNAGMFHVERTLDSSGSPTSDGFCTFMWGTAAGSPGSQWQMIPNTGSVPSANTTTCPALDVGATGGNEVFGGNTAMCPMLGILGKISEHSLLVYRDADLGALGSATVTIHGASHTFMPLGVAVRNSGFTPNANSNTAIAMRWE